MDAPEPLRNAEEAQPIVPMHVAASSCEVAVDAKNLVLLEFPMPIKHTQTGQNKALAMLGGLEKVCHETRSLHGSLPLQLVPNPVGCSMISDIPSDRMEGSGSNSRSTYALRCALTMRYAAIEARP
eukprot:7317-Heterococcus_DN1.PRE.14